MVFEANRLAARGDKKSLVLYGPSRTGKTTWARSLGKHAYWHGEKNLEKFLDMRDVDIDYLVIDDIGGLKYFPKYKMWLGHQDEIDDHDKWIKKTTINWGRPAIWCSNNDPRDEDAADVDWLNENCTFVYLGSKIFQNPSKRKLSVFVEPEAEPEVEESETMKHLRLLREKHGAPFMDDRNDIFNSL